MWKLVPLSVISSKVCPFRQDENDLPSLSVHVPSTSDLLRRDLVFSNKSVAEAAQ